MFLHARKGHVEPLGQGCDRSVRTPELLQNAASGGVRQRAERGIEVGVAILSHTVQYTTWMTVTELRDQEGDAGDVVRLAQLRQVSLDQRPMEHRARPPVACRPWHRRKCRSSASGQARPWGPRSVLT